MGLLLLSSTILAEVTNVEISREYIEKNNIKIIDIRTQSEWEKMGVIKGAYLITFFPEDTTYNPKLFLQELNRVVDKDEQFALVSNTSSRSKLVSNFLGKKNNYHVVNLVGGMKKLIADGYKVEAYNPDTKSKKKVVEKTEPIKTKKAKIKKAKTEKVKTKKRKKEVMVIEKEKTIDAKESNSTTT
jgi:rhodanese-related sulfurtransferase